jgi:hypothetical protein
VANDKKKPKHPLRVLLDKLLGRSRKTRKSGPQLRRRETGEIVNPKEKRIFLLEALRNIGPGGPALAKLAELKIRGAELAEQNRVEREVTEAHQARVAAGVHPTVPLQERIEREAGKFPPAIQYDHEGNVKNFRELLAFNEKKDLDKRETIRETIMYILQNKMVPRDADQAAQALDAILSFDRDKLINAPGTLIPELMTSLTLIPGSIQALRDVVMDFQADDVGWLTAAAAVSVPLPLLGMARQAGQVTRTAEKMLRLEHYTPADLGGTVKVSKQGTRAGFKGEERARKNKPKRAYFNKAGTKPEYLIEGYPKYVGEVPAASVYDLDADPLDMMKVKTATGRERKLIQTGYRGYSRGDVVAMFDDVPVQRSASDPKFIDELVEIVDDPKNAEGFTFHMGKNRTLDVMGADDEVLVGVSGRGIKLNTTDAGIPATRVAKFGRQAHLREWLTKSAAEIDADPSLHIGGWRAKDPETGKLEDHFDLVRNMGTDEAAKQAMRPGAFGQDERAAFNVKTADEIPNPYYSTHDERREFLREANTVRMNIMGQKNVPYTSWRKRKLSAQGEQTSFLPDEPRYRTPTVDEAADTPFAREAFYNLRKFQEESVVPETVYHGSPNWPFKPRRPGDPVTFKDEGEGLGSHFGTKGAAKRFMGTRDVAGGTRRITDVRRRGAFRLNMKNPIRLPDMGTWEPDAVIDEIADILGKHGNDLRAQMFDEVGGLPPIDSHAYRTGGYRAAKDWWIRGYLQEQGFDGIVYKNIHEKSIKGKLVVVGPAKWSQLDDSYIVFNRQDLPISERTAQVKSLDRNVGLYDLHNENIYLGLTGAALAGGAIDAQLSDDHDNELAAAGIILLGTGGRINPRQAMNAARAVGRSGREAEKIIEAARVAGRPTKPEVVRALTDAMSLDELNMMNLKSRQLGVANAAQHLDDPDVLAEAAIAGLPSMGGYERTTQFLHDTFGPDASMMAGLIAVTSPNQRVQANLDDAFNLFETWVRAGRPKKAANVLRQHPRIRKLFGENVTRILEADDPLTMYLSGPKVDNFFGNLVGDMQRLTLDTHMGNLQGLDWHRLSQSASKAERVKMGIKTVPTGEYLGYSAQTRRVADRVARELGIPVTPANIQETQWSFTRALPDTPGGDLVKFNDPTQGIPLAERVNLIDPADVRQGWDVPRHILAGSAYDVLDRLQQAQELRGATIGRVPPWADISARAADPDVLRFLAGERIQPSLFGQYRWRGPGRRGVLSP